MKAKKEQKNDAGRMVVRFSIGAKLITIITIIVLLSLGSITVLVSWLISGDLRVLAEDNNFEVNRRSAMEAESAFTAIRANSIMLLQTVNALGSRSNEVTQTLNLFYEQNPQIALILFAIPGKEDMLHINNEFFSSHGIDQSRGETFPDNYRPILRRVVSGETLLLNETPWFKTPILAYMFPSQGGALAIMFSPENLYDSFAFGTNLSYLINNTGDILIHADSDLVRDAVNIAEMDFTKFVLENPQRNVQVLYNDEDGVNYFRAFTKMDTAGAVVITSIEYNKVFEGIAATTRRNVYLTFTVLSISILLIWFFSKTITAPLRLLASKAQAIEKGDFEFELHSKSTDETGVLTASFKRMSAALSVFGKFTNREIAVRAMLGEIKPGGQPKNATILFTDMRDFTEKSEKFTKIYGTDASNQIVLWLNEYFTRMVECVQKTGGVVDKFMGDAIMAHWGTAYTAGNPQKDAINCIRATLMMRKALYEMNKTHDPNDPGNPAVSIGCGINTGIVTAGQIGSDLRMEYTVIGDPVNLAFRMESMCKMMAADILITENTWRLVKDYFITEEMQEVSVKGSEKKIKIFAIVNVAGAEKGPKTLEEIRKLMGIKKPVFQRRSSDVKDPSGSNMGSGR